MTAASSISPLDRGSRPTTATGRPFRPFVAVAPSRRADAEPTANASSAVSSRLATPRTPSVPNSRPMRTNFSHAPTEGTTLEVIGYLAAVLAPNRDRRETGSALRVLRRLARLLQPVLLAFGRARVAGEEAGPLQRRAVLWLHQDQRPSDRQAQCASLAGGPAPVQVCVDVERVHPVDGHQRRLDQLLVHLIRKVVLQSAPVQVEPAGARHQAHPNDGLLAAADRLDRAVDNDGLPRPPRRRRRRLGGLGGLGCVDGLGCVGVGGGLCCLGHWLTCLISYGTGCWALCGCSGPA